MNNLRYALRLMRKSPGFTLVAVLTLAFGIGVNTNIFSMVSAFFLQPLPVKDADRLVLVLQRSPLWKMPHGLSYPDYQDYRAQCLGFVDLLAYFPMAIHLGVSGQPAERTWIDVVSPNTFKLLDLQPSVGRLFSPADGEGEGIAPVVVLSHHYWQRRFGGNPAIVGQNIQLNGKPFTVIGVAPAGFQSVSWSMSMSAFVPSGLAPRLADQGGFLDNRGAPVWRLMGKLKPDTSLKAARAEVNGVAQHLARAYPKEHEGAQVLVIRESQARPDPTFADFMPVFALLFTAMVGLVLFIACANVANLMFARALTRQRELVLRAALGANRRQLIRQLLVESLVLSVFAGGLGMLLAQLGGVALERFMPASDIPVNNSRGWDWRVYVFAVGISLLAGLAAGVFPALKASRFNLFESLKETGGDRGTAGRHRFRNFLVIGQVTVSVVVLICGGLFLHSLRRAQQLDFGFRTDHLLVASLDLGLQGYRDDRARLFQRELLEKARALPGVTGATLATQIPFDIQIRFQEIWPDKPPAHFKDGKANLYCNRVGSDYMRVLGIPILRGRDLQPADREDHPNVALVNEAFAKECWPGEDALGRRFRVNGTGGPEVEVVGIVPTGKYVMLSESPRPCFFLPLAQHPGAPVTVLLRTRTAPEGFTQPLRELVRSLDPDLPVYNERSMAAHIQSSVFGLLPLRMGATLAALQGGIGLLLAVLGLYAVVAYSVNRRTQEIGIRMALGARRLDVIRLVIREGLRLTLIGTAIGLVLALGLGFVLSHVLFGLGRVDAWVLLGVSSLLLGVSGLACYLPARRATRVDPLVALRCE